MKTATVVTAFNPRNAGMYSVDLAAHQFFADLGIRPKMVQTQASRTWKTWRFFGRVRSKIVRDPAKLVAEPLLVYWGDFLNNPMYGITDYALRDILGGYAANDAEAFRNWARLFLLSETPKNGTRVIAASGNFHGTSRTLEGLQARERAEIVDRFEHSFDAIFPRDPASTQDLLAAAPNAAGGRVTTALDAAFLLDPVKAFRDLSHVKPRRTFTYTFGRSDLTGTDELIRVIEQATGLEAVPLARWLRLSPRFAGRQFHNLLSQIRASVFTITDTYHCAINAMNLDRPVIGIGRLSDGQETTVSDFKKRILFKMFGLESQYVELAEPTTDHEGRQRIVELAVDFATGASHRDVYDSLRQQKAAYRDLLTEAILGGS